MSGFVKPLSIPGVLHPTPCFYPPSCPAPALPRDALENKREISEPRADFPTGIEEQLWVCCTSGNHILILDVAGWFMTSLKMYLQGKSCLLEAPLETCWVKLWGLSPRNHCEGAEPRHRAFWYVQRWSCCWSSKTKQCRSCQWWFQVAV